MKKCGNCIHWMKSSSCPREKTRKPDCDDFPCKKWGANETICRIQPQKYW